MVLRDANANIIFSACQQLLNCLDPFEAEEKACEEGFRLALHWCDKPLELELDCKLLVDSIQEESRSTNHTLPI